MPKVSVVTPIYNVAQFLPQCLDSLKAQTLEDIEFICVNDGSTDNSLEILQRYAEQDPRFVVIDKPNGGYGHTMNTGIDAARGEYIGIVESDDWINPDAFEKLYALAERYNHCDIVKANHNVFVASDEPVQVENFTPDMCDRLLSPLVADGAKVINSIPAIWAAIYRRDFLAQAGIRFLETPGASFQDTGFVFKSWLAANSFVLTHDSYLNYRMDNAGSSSASVEKVMFVCEEFASIEQFLDALPERREKLLGRVLSKKFNTYLWNYDRIAPEYQEEFLRHIAKEFEEPFAQGQIDPAVFMEGEYDTLCRILEDPHAAYEHLLRSAKINRALEAPIGIASAVRDRASALIGALPKPTLPKRSGVSKQTLDALKVSVVIPVYNSEKYLAKTLDSLLVQTHKNFELICVNDGSTDGSLAILNDYAARDSRVRVFDQPNSGPSKARNFGIEQSTGGFICFVDADDFVARTMLRLAVEAAQANEADVVIFGIDEYRDDTRQYIPMPHAVVKGKVPYNEVFDPRDVDGFFEYMTGYTVNKLYRTSYFIPLNVRFPVIGAHEDMPFTYAAVAAAHRVFYLNKVLYHYRREREEGSRSDDTEEQFTYMQKALECTRDELVRLGVYEDYERDFVNYVAHMCRWKFTAIFGKPRQHFYAAIANGWLESMGALGHDDSYFYNKKTRKFMHDFQNATYLDMVEYLAEQGFKALKDICESKSFRLSEAIATPVRKLRGDKDPDDE